MGALFECQRSQIRVPEDLAIAGFNNLEPSASLNPSLTTVDSLRYEMGEIAAQMLLDRMRGATSFIEPKIIDLGYNIIIRRST